MTRTSTPLVQQAAALTKLVIYIISEDIIQTNKYRLLASAERDEVATYILCGLTE